MQSQRRFLQLEEKIEYVSTKRLKVKESLKEWIN